MRKVSSRIPRFLKNRIDQFHRMLGFRRSYPHFFLTQAEGRGQEREQA